MELVEPLQCELCSGHRNMEALHPGSTASVCHMLPTACVLRLSTSPDLVVCPEHLGDSSPWGKHQEVWVESLC